MGEVAEVDPDGRGDDWNEDVVEPVETERPKEPPGRKFVTVRIRLSKQEI